MTRDRYNLRPRVSKVSVESSPSPKKPVVKKRKKKNKIAADVTTSATSQQRESIIFHRQHQVDTLLREDLSTSSISESEVRDDNQIISIDLNAIQIDTANLRHSQKPIELKTILYPIEFDACHTQGQSFVSCTYLDEVNKVAPQKFPKYLDMPMLDCSALLSPSPTCSSPFSFWQDKCDTISHDSHGLHDLHDSMSPLGFLDDINNNFANKENKAVVKRKYKRGKNRKVPHRILDSTIALWDSIIKDDELIQQVRQGRKPRFRVVAQDRSAVKPYKSINYRKSRLKIKIANILMSTFPNAEWSRDVASGTATFISDGVGRKKEDVKEENAGIRVLSNILVQPVQSTVSNWEVAENQNGGAHKHNQLNQHISCVHAEQSEISVTSSDDSFTYFGTLEVGSRQQRTVDIFINEGVDCTDLIDRLDPDCIPIVHWNRDQDQGYETSSTTLTPCQGRPDSGERGEELRSTRRITRSFSKRRLTMEMLEYENKPRTRRRKTISKITCEVSVVLERLDLTSQRFSTIPQVDGDDGGTDSSDSDTDGDDGESNQKLNASSSSSLSSSPSMRRLRNSPLLDVSDFHSSSEMFLDLALTDVELHSVSPSASANSSFRFPVLGAARVEREICTYSSWSSGRPSKPKMKECKVIITRIPRKVMNIYLQKAVNEQLHGSDGCIQRTSTSVDVSTTLASPSGFSYSGSTKALDVILSETRSQCNIVGLKDIPMDTTYAEFKGNLDPKTLSTPMCNLLKPSFDSQFKRNCVVNIPKISEDLLSRHLAQRKKRPDRPKGKRGRPSNPSSTPKLPRILTPTVCRYNLRKRRGIPQVDGADDESSSSDDDECITTRSKTKIVNTKRLPKSQTKMAARGLRAGIVKAEEVKYPTLDITVTQSPHASFRNSPRRNISTTSPRRPRTPRRLKVSPKQKQKTLNLSADVDAASRKLNFDLGTNKDQTFIEEKVECRYRPDVGSTQNENVTSLLQLKQQILSKASLPEGANTLELSEEKTLEVEAVVEDKIRDESMLSHLTLRISEGTEEMEVGVEEDGNQSDELFSPSIANIPDEKVPSNEDVTFTSSLEALITPYQENQPNDDVMDLYNSQCSIFGDGTQQPEPVNKLLTKADEYDIANRMLVQAGPSKCPSSFESAIMFSPERTKDDTDTISVLDLTSHLEASEVQEIAKMDTISLNSASLQSTQYTSIAYLTPKYKPPSCKLITETMATYNIPEHRNQDPYYSDAKHVTGAVDVGHNTLRILARHHYEEFTSSFGTLTQYQKLVSGVLNRKELRRLKLSYCTSKSIFVQPLIKPPSVKDVKLWLLKKKRSAKKRQVLIEDAEDVEEETCKEVQDHETTDMLGLTISEGYSEVTSPRLNKSSWDNSHAISGVSLNNTHGFKMTLENLQEARSLDIYQYITSLVMELHAECRGDKYPDPQIDAVQVIFFALANDVPEKSPPTSGVDFGNVSIVQDQTEHFLKGFIYVSPSNDVLTGSGIPVSKYVYTVPDEMSLYQKFLEVYHTWNPDILMGYKIEQSSWGYFVERGYVLGFNMPLLLSRIKDTDKKKQPTITPQEEDHQEEHHSHLKITGRIVIDLWRILKHEIALQSYTFENLAYHVLHERVPHYSPRELGLWWNHKSSKYRHRTVDYFLYRVEGAFRLIDHYDLIGRTSELARLFGILFYEVLSRGSQFRVESMMLRLAKPYKYVPVSPNVQQRAHMKAPEFLPLILEPESKFYKDPVIVLDFQSLYPSIIIGYNYCFSTCLGRVEHLATDAKFEFGAYELEVSKKLIGKYLKANLLTISPCGVAFVKESVRPGIMPRMLREILDTRLMVKKSMKKHKGNKTLQKVLHSRQLGLKLIANVTYGYTAANFSGRMPACELADSVVSKGRETLQRAINLVEKHPSWGARVVYGDTDSLFVLCAGKSREEAFRIGEEIVEAVTNENPSPIRLKLEKVYQPCILQTKKRYVGYMYESKEQKVPEFEAKGIETVRRDGCPAASKMLEKCLKLLFDHRDVSQVRNYVLKQFHKILTGRVSIQDLTFAKEYRGREGYRPGACVPALELTRKWMSSDKRKEPRSGERVPYVIVNGPPGLPLIKLVKSPHDLLEDSSLRPNALYYITKAIIPPINRCFKLIGADLFNWFNDMPRKQMQYLHVGSPSKGPKSTISQYFATAACASCGVQTKDGLCAKCLTNPQSTIVSLHKKIYMWERNYYTCKKICESCCGRSTDLACNSLDCPVLYRTKQTTHDLQQTDFVRSLIDFFPEDDNLPELF